MNQMMKSAFDIKIEVNLGGPWHVTKITRQASLHALSHMTLPTSLPLSLSA